MENVTTHQVNHAKKEILRLRVLKKKFSNDLEAVQDINTLIARHTKFVARGQEVLESRKIPQTLC